MLRLIYFALLILCTFTASSSMASKKLFTGVYTSDLKPRFTPPAGIQTDWTLIRHRQIPHIQLAGGELIPLDSIIHVNKTGNYFAVPRLTSPAPRGREAFQLGASAQAPEIHSTAHKLGITIDTLEPKGATAYGLKTIKNVDKAVFTSTAIEPMTALLHKIRAHTFRKANAFRSMPGGATGAAKEAF